MTQSNEPTITEMNIVLAVFDGWVLNKNGTVSNLNSIDKFENRPLELTTAVLQYHTSWDWLMPCWNKLRSELYQCMPASGFNDGFDKYGDAWKTACFNAEIQNAHKVVYSAIKWLNQQKQKDGDQEAKDI